ncbi:hypothetical protein QNM99_15875 [Pseudomonas sp. PCH446]
MAVEPIDALLTVFHPCVLPATTAAARLGLKATCVEGVMNARDKARCRDLIQQAGLPSVQFRRVSGFEEARQAALAIGYPVVVKPSTGLAKMMVKIIAHEQALTAYFEQYNQSLAALDEAMRAEIDDIFVVEEVAVGPLFSIEVAVSAMTNGCPWPSCVARPVEATRCWKWARPCLQASPMTSIRWQPITPLPLSKPWTGSGHLPCRVYLHRQRPKTGRGQSTHCGRRDSRPDKRLHGANLFELLVRIHTGERLGLGRLASQTYSSHSFIAAEQDCTVREDLPEDWFSPIRAQLHSGVANIKAGSSFSTWRATSVLMALSE